MKKFIFDVDGTLTESRKQIDEEFSTEFLKFCCTYDTYLVTGSDRKKTIDQVGLDIYNRCRRVFQCSGADIYVRNKNVYRSSWQPPRDLVNFLSDELDYSAFPYKTGNHIEHRPGGINFSIIGRGENSMEHRKDYVKWDKERDERVLIADRIINQFPHLNIQIGGQTGLDISDNDKSQILKFFSPFDEIHFFGDMMKQGQNDYPLAEALREWGGYPHCVKNWEDTRTELRKYVELDTITV